MKLFNFTKQITCYVLLSISLVQCSSNDKESIENTTTSSTLISNENEHQMRIAFVNSDTVSKYYDFAEKIQTSLLNKRNAAENQFKDKMNNYQKLRSDFEKAAPIMGEREKMEKAQNIMALEQEIMKFEQDLSEQLAQEELKITEDYILKTHEYMQVIGKELGYDYVLSFRIGGPMLYADPAHDITQDVIELLNERYNSITIE
tara:strand:+ start:2968 stop:3576 length:609 start_codon:yes stop_codon:yes gene_type:complete